ncbi:MAG: DUF177 domain-containing protein [Myxococcales bacterium]|nr:DUF177 domain-containing protein [Myxococcales bacterium]
MTCRIKTVKSAYEMAEFVLHLPDLETAPKAYAWTIPSSWLTHALSAHGLRPDPGGRPGALEVNAQRNGTDILVEGEMRAALIGECFRCLEDAHFEVQGRLGALLGPRGAAGVTKPGEVVELTPEDLERDYYTGERIILDDMVRDQLVLEAPMQPLCREDCSGIPLPPAVRSRIASEEVPVSPGKIDPRLAPLLKFRDKAKP